MTKTETATVLFRASQMFDEKKYEGWLTKDVYVDVLKRLAKELSAYDGVRTT